MSQPAFREQITRLSLSAGALSVVGAAIDAKVTGNPLEPDIQSHVDAALDALGVGDAITELGAPELRPVLRQAGYVDVQMMPAPPGAVAAMIAATRRATGGSISVRFR